MLSISKTPDISAPMGSMMCDVRHVIHCSSLLCSYYPPGCPGAPEGPAEAMENDPALPCLLNLTMDTGFCENQPILVTIRKYGPGVRNIYHRSIEVFGTVRQACIYTRCYVYPFVNRKRGRRHWTRRAFLRCWAYLSVSLRDLFVNSNCGYL